MSLTGWLLPTLLALGAAILLVSIVLGLPRTPGWRAALIRLTQLAGFTLLVVSLAGYGVNRNENLYGTWTDLYRYVSKTAPPPRTVTFGGPAPTAATLSGTSTPSATPTKDPIPNLPPLPSTERIQHLQVTGAASGLNGEVTIVLPEGYDPKAATAYPVLYALYGFPGAHSGFLDPANMDYTGQVDRAVAAKKLRAPIVVIPQLAWHGIDSECVDGPQGNVFTWLSTDVPTWMEGHLRVAKAKTSWATTGYSAGGWCAAWIGMKNPNRFGAVMSFGGYFKPVFSTNYQPLTQAQIESPEHNLAAMAATNPPIIAIWSQVARGDSVSYPSHASFMASIKAPVTGTEVTIDGSGHGFHQWRPYVPNSLDWLATTLPGFAP